MIVYVRPCWIFLRFLETENMLMSKKDSYQTDGTLAGRHVIGLAWDARWVFRLMCMFIFFDIAMLLRFGIGVLNASKDVFNNIGLLAVIFMVFGMLAAIVIPVALNVYRFLSRSL